MKLTKLGQETVNNDLQRKLSNLVRTIIPSTQLLQIPHLIYFHS
jgi:hypothetical protein